MKFSFFSFGLATAVLLFLIMNNTTRTHLYIVKHLCIVNNNFVLLNITPQKHITRVPQCLSPRPNWDPSTPSPPIQCSNPPPPPREKRGMGHTRLRVRGGGGPNSDDWRKSLVLCLHYSVHSPMHDLKDDELPVRSLLVSLKVQCSS